MGLDMIYSEDEYESNFTSTNNYNYKEDEGAKGDGYQYNKYDTFDPNRYDLAYEESANADTRQLEQMKKQVNAMNRGKRAPDIDPNDEDLIDVPAMDAPPPVEEKEDPDLKDAQWDPKFYV